MKKTIYLFVAIIFCLAGIAVAQIGSPISFGIAVGGGLSAPSGDLSNVSSTGYHGAAKARFGSIGFPFDLTGAVAYHRLPDKTGSEATNMIQIAAGIEYPIPSIEIKPYFLAEFTFNSISRTAANTSSYSREGLNLGAGVQLLGFDGSLKYQMLNLLGKENNEGTNSQITATICYMIGF